MLKIRMILAEDEERIRQGIRKSVDFRRLGIEVVAEAGSGDEALSVIEREQPDLILLDVRMPEGDGFDVLRTLEIQESSIDVVILSGYDDFSYAQKAMQYGVSRYLLKPCSKPVLEEVLAERRKVILDKKKETLYHMREQCIGDAASAISQRLARFNCFRVFTLSSEKCDFLMIRDRLVTLCGEFPHSPEIEYFSAEGRIYGLFGYKDNVPSLNDALLQKFLKVEASGWMVGISREQSDGNALEDCIREAKEALRLGFYDLSGIKLYDEAKGFTQEVPYPKALAGKILDALMPFHQDAFEAALSKFFLEMEEKRPDPEKAICMGKKLVDSAFRIFSLWQGESSQEGSLISPPEFLEKETRSFSSLKMTVRSTLTDLALEPVPQAVDYVSSTLNYMKLHFTEDIGLETISQELGITAPYLSSLFKKSTGSNFHNSLTDIRIAEACRLLLTTSIPVKEIAQVSGFFSTRNFMYVFKRKKGCSPGEFRRSNTADNLHNNG